MRTALVCALIATALAASWDLAPWRLLVLFALLAVPAWLHGFCHALDAAITFLGGRR